MRGVFLRGVLLGALAASLFPGIGAHADGPDMDGAVSLMKSALKDSLSEQSPCLFRAVPPGGKGASTFHAGALEVVASAISASGVQFECRKQRNCVTGGDGKTANTVAFEVHGPPPAAAIAISRVVEMCTASAPK